MASTPSAPDSPSASAESEDNAAEIPMSMHQSMQLELLPRNTHDLLKKAGELEQSKVTIRLSPLPNTPALKSPRFKVSSNARFETVANFVRRKLKARESDALYCYVNSVFAPGLDEGVGNLWRCFRTGNELVISYSYTQAFG